MRNPRYILLFILLLIAQMLLQTYFNFSQMIMLTILPTMILLTSMKNGTIRTMMLAFVAGLTVDFLTGSALGLTSLALVPVALSRRSIIKITYGQEIFARNEEISIKKYGWRKFIISCTLSNALFILIFVWADGAGMRPFLFDCLKVLISLTLSTILSLSVVPILCREDYSKWM